MPHTLWYRSPANQESDLAYCCFKYTSTTHIFGNTSVKRMYAYRSCFMLLLPAISTELE